jgi:caffeoyl-CoA O-methyltransferase
MSAEPNAPSAELLAYLAERSVREPDVVRQLRLATGDLEQAAWRTPPEQGQFMALLAEIAGVRSFLEVGTFTGYGTLWIALALPADGRIVTCDLTDEYVRVGEPFWRQAGVADKIDLRLAPALETLQALQDAGDAGRFDLAFIDADKESYEAYFEAVLPLLRTGGLLMIDNVLWGGRAADPSAADSDTRAIRALNARLKEDARISLSLLPISDGLTLARKR